MTPRGNLEVLLLAAIRLREVSLDGSNLILWRFSKGDPVLLSGLDSKSESCQRFFRDGLYSSLLKS